VRKGEGKRVGMGCFIDFKHQSFGLDSAWRVWSASWERKILQEWEVCQRIIVIEGLIWKTVHRGRKGDKEARDGVVPMKNGCRVCPWIWKCYYRWG
jgi:hypothetical protein